jgi:hypothetical protein
MGSTSKYVMENADCNVTVVRTPPGNKDEAPAASSSAAATTAAQSDAPKSAHERVYSGEIIDVPTATAAAAKP